MKPPNHQTRTSEALSGQVILQCSQGLLLMLLGQHLERREKKPSSSLARLSSLKAGEVFVCFDVCFGGGGGGGQGLES